jgi:hypothetical protein
MHSTILRKKQLKLNQNKTKIIVREVKIIINIIICKINGRKEIIKY